MNVVFSFGKEKNPYDQIPREMLRSWFCFATSMLSVPFPNNLNFFNSKK